MTGYIVICDGRPVWRGPEERLRVEVFSTRQGAENALGRIRFANRVNGVSTEGYTIQPASVSTTWRYPEGECP